MLTDEDSWTSTGSFTVTGPSISQKGITNLSAKLPQILPVNTDEERKINDVKTESMISSTMVVYNSNNKVVSQFNNCAGDSLELAVSNYTYEMDVSITGPLALNDTMMKEMSLEINAFQPLLVWSSSAPASLEGKTVNLSNSVEMALGGNNFAQLTAKLSHEPEEP